MCEHSFGYQMNSNDNLARLINLEPVSITIKKHQQSATGNKINKLVKLTN